MAEISVIVPIYKVEKYIDECIQSVLKQTFSDYELILVDDGSPDNCGTICDEYAKRDKRIHVIHQKNGGISAARNAGLNLFFSNIGNKYVTFIDSDDWISAHYLEQLYTTAITTDADIVSCEYSSKQLVENDDRMDSDNIRIISGRNALIARYKGDAQIRVSSWGKLYRRNLLEGLSFPEGKIHEDQWFSTMAYYFANKTVFLNDKLYFYRLRNDSITGSEFSMKRFDNVELMDRVIRFFKDNNDMQLTELASLHREKTCAQYVLMSKVKSAGRIPSQFKMSKNRALSIVHRYLPREKFIQYFQMLYPRIYRVYKLLYCIKEKVFYKR